MDDGEDFLFRTLLIYIYISFSRIKNKKKIKGGSLRLIILYILDKIYYEVLYIK